MRNLNKRASFEKTDSADLILYPGDEVTIRVEGIEFRARFEEHDDNKHTLTFTALESAITPDCEVICEENETLIMAQ